MFNIFRSLGTKNHLLHGAAFSLAFIFLILSSAQVNAACTVNGISYRTNSDTSGTYITHANIYGRRQNWNNNTDLVTTCDVSQFTDMWVLFYQDSTFNQDLSAWDTSSVTNMGYMFIGATSLTSVTLPQTGAVTNMSSMFSSASSFAQDIRAWDVDNVLSFSSMFSGATAMISAYSSTPNWGITPSAA
jgi:surface protein